MKSRSSSAGLVYSTENGRMCPDCRQSLAACRCSTARARATGAGATSTATVWRETKGRAGKAVTVIRGLMLEPAALQALGKQLKTACGSGGTVKDGVIEVQGDHAERIVAALRAQGIAVKRAGASR